MFPKPLIKKGRVSEAGFQSLFAALHLAAVLHALATAYHLKKLKNVLE